MRTYLQLERSCCESNKKNPPGACCGPLADLNSSNYHLKNLLTDLEALFAASLAAAAALFAASLA